MILAYIRVSSDGQNEGTSPEEQERILRGFAMMRGVDAFGVAFFRDTVSGSVPLPERPGGKEMLAMARKGDMIVACKLDRLFRSASDALNMAEMLKVRGVDLVLTDMGNDPVTSNGTAKLFFTLLAAVAEFERGRIAERVSSGKRVKAARGGHIGGQAPYGWRRVGKGRTSTVVKNEQEQEIIREIEAIYAETKGNLMGTAIRITKLGRRNRNRTPFEATQIKRIILRNGPESRLNG